jgi:metal-sulfur cluster biosynthetic enzyme
MVTREQVYDALRDCYDPEIPINIVDLGLVYDIAIDEDHVNVVMTLTARGCPAHTFISDGVRQRVAKISGVKSANVQVVWDPPWDVSRVSEEGKKRLGLM